MRQLLNADPWTNFLRGVNSKATEEIYSFAIKKRFMKFRNVSEVSALLDGTNEELENSFMDYIAWEKDNQVSVALIRVRCSAIKKFYKRNRKALNWDIIYETIGKGRRVIKDKAYNHKQIGAVVAIADRREKALVLLFASSGVRRGAIPLLRKRDLQPLDDYGIYRITVYSGEPEEYVTYCTPETRAAIEDYFAFRQKCGEEIGDHSFVFRNSFDVTDPIRAKKAKPLTDSTLESILERILVKAGVREHHVLLEGEHPSRIHHEIKIMHGFRKFFDSQCTEAGMNNIWIHIIEGHDVQGLKGNYYRVEEAEILHGNERHRGYLDCIDYLTIDENNKLQRKVKQLTQEKDKMWQETTNMMKDLQAQINELAKR